MMSSCMLRGLGLLLPSRERCDTLEQAMLWVRCNAYDLTVSVVSSPGAYLLCAFAAEDDIVMQTFKKQQKAYRDLLKGMEVHLF